MSDTDTRYKLMPLDKCGLVYLGLDMSNGKRAALFVADNSLDNEYAHLDTFGTVTDSDYVFWDLLNSVIHSADDEEGNTNIHIVEIDGLPFRVKPWTEKFDLLLVEMIDRIIDMRMKNASIVSRTLQLEMAI